jgi:hypothetical protein
MADDTRAGARKPPGSSDPIAPDLFTVRITVTRESFDSLLKKFDLDVGCRPHVHANPDGTGGLTAFATRERIREIEAAGYKVDIVENASELGRQRLEEVGKGDRFEGGRVVPRGLGQKTRDRGEGGPRQ